MASNLLDEFLQSVAESEFDAQLVDFCAGGSGGTVESRKFGYGHAGGLLGRLYYDGAVFEER